MWVHVQGKMTTTFLGITVLSDIYVLICMSITMSLTKASKNPFFFSLQYLESVFSMVYRVHVAYMPRYTRARALGRRTAFPCPRARFCALSLDCFP